MGNFICTHKELYYFHISVSSYLKGAMMANAFIASRSLALAAVLSGVFGDRAHSYESPAPEISLAGLHATISWPGIGILETSATLDGDWTDSGAVSSPHTISVTSSPQQFLRVRYETLNYVTVDTNQTDYYDESGDEITPPPATGDAYFGQDAEYAETPPSYIDHGNGTATDRNTGLMWQTIPPAAFYSWPEAQTYADNLGLAGHDDWRLPSLKELLSLADFNGSSRPEIDRPYIDGSVFEMYDPTTITDFIPERTRRTKRDIDGQFWSSNAYVGRTINNDSSTFGFNFIDGRIKSYPNGVISGPTGTAFVRCVRGNPNYGKNNFIDNGDGTVIDLATGLMWLQTDSGAFPDAGSQGSGTLDWIEALDWAENLEFAGYDDWTLPDAKQLQSIVDYTRAPDADDPAMQSAAIDPVFHLTETEAWFWTSTSLGDDLFKWGVYICFGRALAIDKGTGQPTVNAHGAGAMRSDPKTVASPPVDYSGGHGPQFDQVRIYNYARPVRRAFTPPSAPPAATPGNITGELTGTAPVDLAEIPTSVTFNGSAVNLTSVSRPGRQQISFDFPIQGLSPGDYTMEAVFAGSSTPLTGTFTIRSSILLLIVDDWGHDASPLDNSDPNALHARMPNLATLASQGLRFTNAYSQPVCSPMRATMLTGRQVWQHDVGVPGDERNFSADEITLPEIFTTMGASHRMLSVGKWHLGGNDTGYSTRGDWPEFYGINSGGVTNYFNWSKNSNGSTAITTTYSTTDQVNEAKTFIDAQVAAGNPWFAWVAFNAPHTPYHDPPAELAPAGGYSAIGSEESTESHQYRMMLEALDTEMGRLLESVDPVQTNIILLGDNGTPGGVIQTPYGSGHAKGSIYNGGTHVPMIAKGPAVTVVPGTTTDTPIHCIDLFSTILDLAGINEDAVPSLVAQGVTSTSIVPIFNGTDTADRCVVAEKQGNNPARAILLGVYPDYKLIIQGDPDSTLDTPSFEFYNIGAPGYDVNEQIPLDTASLSGTALDAYNACIAKDLALGGGYSDPPGGGFDTVYIELPASVVRPPVPPLTRPNGNPLKPTSVTVDGQTATIIGRFSSGSVLFDESDDPQNRYWVKARLSPAHGGPYTTAHVIFPPLPQNLGGTAREYDSINTIFANPNP
jgi:arylsulfatase A-like enzyme